MARYRWLQAGYVGGAYFEPGEIATLPDTFVPGPACEPLDEPAIAAFHRAGPQLCPLVVQRWFGMPIDHHPKIYWKQIGPAFHKTYQLVGAEHLGIRQLHGRGELP